MHFLSLSYNLVDVVCLWGLKITRLDLVERIVCQQCKGWCASDVGWCVYSDYLNFFVFE